jgi:outer membrane biosynthesis protein TonB
MLTGNRKAAGLAISLALIAVGLTACGSGDDETTTTAPPRPLVSRETADHLAKLSNTVAANLEVGETCDAAIAADQLKAAVEDSDLAASVRPSVETVVTDLVNEVNCPPPPPPEPEKKPKKEKDEEHGNGDHGNGNGNDQGGDEHTPPGHSKHGGFVPPGHAKLKGEKG